MNKLSIKNKVTIYYSMVLIFLVLLVFTVFLFTADLQVRSASETAVKEAVSRSFDNVEYENNILEIDNDFDSYYRGVTLIVYDEEGNLIKGTVPTDFPSTPLSSGNLEEITTPEETWLIYDIYNTYDNGQGLWVRGIYSMDNSKSALLAIIKIMVIILPILILISLFVGRRITKNSFKPITRINETAQEIKDGNDLSKRLPLGKTKDELYYLTITLNDMINRLEQAFVSEKNFTSDVSHDLKTPLSVIKAECEYLLQGNFTPSELNEGLESIEKQCNKTLSLIQQLLQMSHLMSSENILEKENFNISLLAKDTLDQLKSFPSKKKITLQENIEPDVFFYGDQTLIMRLLINLISNGIKYSKDIDNAYVSLTLVKKNDHIIITVSDNGIGISSEDLPNIFNRFYKADKSRRKEDDSFGLGLAMAKWICYVHQGEIVCESKLGEGTKFIVTL